MARLARHRKGEIKRRDTLIFVDVALAVDVLMLPTCNTGFGWTRAVLLLRTLRPPCVFEQANEHPS